MTRYVLDASALLAWLQEEPGGDLVEQVLEDSSVSVVNWSEVLQKSTQKGRDADLVGQVLMGLGVKVEPAEESDAVAAAMIWPSARHLALADRFCLALALRLERTVITADTTWARASINTDINYLR